MSGVYSSKALLAMQAMVFIAYHGREGVPVKSNQIINRYKLNSRALEPVMQVLSRAGLVESKQGANGGYVVSTPETTTLADVTRLFMEKPEGSIVTFGDLRFLLLPGLEQGYHAALEQLAQHTLADICRMAEGGSIEPLAATPLDFTI